MNILFYTPFNQRSRDTESLMQAFVNQKHAVFLLTQAKWGVYHEQCKKLGVKVYDHYIEKKNPLVYYLKHGLHLFLFCRSNKIDIVYAHLETAALPAVMVQYFIRARVFACRHMIDEAVLFGNRNFIRIVRIVYKLARQIIVVSEHCRNYMIEQEQVSPVKIQVIRLGYNFDFYNRPRPEEVMNIRAAYPCQMLLITACRLVAPKRPAYAVHLMKNLRAKSLDVKLLLLGEGIEFTALQELIRTENLGDSVFLLGHRPNITDYISAADALVHPSILDSSSVIIKEAGLQEKLVIACSEIGDVDEYLVNGENAVLVSKDHAVEEMTQAISGLYHDRSGFQKCGVALRKEVINKFSIDKVLPGYNLIHHSL